MRIFALRALIYALFLSSCLPGFSQTNNFFQFIQKQSERHYTKVPHEVLAVYYVWYGYGVPGDEGWKNANTNKHEIANTARYPLKGPYKSQDTAVIDWHIDQAKAHGVTCFVVSWYGLAAQWHDKAFQLLLERAEKKDFKVAIYWETHRDLAQYMLQFTLDDLSTVVGKYGRSKAYLKLDGKPVILAYGRVVEQTPVSMWPEISKKVRARAGDFVLLLDGYQNSYAYVCDGLHTYECPGLSTEVASNLRLENLAELRAGMAHHLAQGAKIARQQNRIFCATVSPGGDARKAYKVKEYTDRLDGQTYRVLWEETLKANPDWIFITSWNEWPEGTEIEPSLELGDKYLKITAEYAKPFLKSAPVNVPPAAPFPKYISGSTREMNRIFSGRKAAVIMQHRMNDSEFWAAYCGATLQRFDWTNLVDAKVFNAKNFPILIHIGNDHYISSVKTTDDVTRALTRYLKEGGFLVSLPQTTWPLLYDMSRERKPIGITDRLGLGIDNGFEQPPAGVQFTFFANTHLLQGLPATAPFPSSGDLRWRPANRSRVPKYDNYFPLVQLKDAVGKSYGEAAVYIEHRTLPISPGKTIYVWMRTAEAVGEDKFYPALFDFISTKLQPLQK